jgi:hypothetical protein
VALVDRGARVATVLRSSRTIGPSTGGAHCSRRARVATPSRPRRAQSALGVALAVRNTVTRWVNGVVKSQGGAHRSRRARVATERDSAARSYRASSGARRSRRARIATPRPRRASASRSSVALAVSEDHNHRDTRSSHGVPGGARRWRRARIATARSAASTAGMYRGARRLRRTRITTSSAAWSGAACRSGGAHRPRRTWIATASAISCSATPRTLASRRSKRARIAMAHSSLTTLATCRRLPMAVSEDRNLQGDGHFDQAITVALAARGERGSQLIGDHQADDGQPRGGARRSRRARIATPASPPLCRSASAWRSPFAASEDRNCVACWADTPIDVNGTCCSPQARIATHHP